MKDCHHYALAALKRDLKALNFMNIVQIDNDGDYASDCGLACTEAKGENELIVNRVGLGH